MIIFKASVNILIEICKNVSWLHIIYVWFMLSSKCLYHSKRTYYTIEKSPQKNSFLSLSFPYVCCSALPLCLLQDTARKRQTLKTHKHVYLGGLHVYTAVLHLVSRTKVQCQWEKYVFSLEMRLNVKSSLIEQITNSRLKHEYAKWSIPQCWKYENVQRDNS